MWFETTSKPHQILKEHEIAQDNVSCMPVKVIPDFLSTV